MSVSVLRVRDKDGNIIEIPAIKGAKGDKGDAYILTDADKTEIADMAKPVIDQSYSPESENAQSGIAVAEAVNTKADSNLVSNAVKGKASGYGEISLNDVSPLPHKVDLTIISKPETPPGSNMLEGTSFEYVNFSSGNEYFRSAPFQLKEGKTYSAMVEIANQEANEWGCIIAPVDWDSMYSNPYEAGMNTPHEFTADFDGVYRIFVGAYKTTLEDILSATVVCKDEAGEPEPVVITVTDSNGNTTNYTPNADGTVDNVISTYPTMQITDNKGWEMVCEYNKDINQYVSGNYEHLKTITITEEITKLTLSTEPDGTPYNFKKLFMKYTLPKLSETVWFTFVFGGLRFGDYMGSKSYHTVYRFEARLENNLLFADFSYHTDHTQNPSYTWKCLARDIRTTPIDKLEIIGSNSIPIGTTFEIWGVRA